MMFVVNYLTHIYSSKKNIKISFVNTKLQNNNLCMNNINNLRKLLQIQHEADHIIQ